MEKMPFFREQSIKSDFKFDKFLGEGSFASVYKGICKHTSEEYAIKIFEKHLLDEEDLLSLQMECEIMANMDHPNIVKLESVYVEKRRIFLVMELMSGGELLDRILDKERFTEDEARTVIRPIVDAVRYCHSIGIVHRDLKPENLLFNSSTSDALIKIADFGVARFILPEEQLMTTACGSPSYIAPEVLKGNGYTFAVDNWSIGVILFVMLFGYPPFYADTNEELFEKIKKGSFEFPSPLEGIISSEGKQLITAILNVNPDERLSAESILAHPWFKLIPTTVSEDENQSEEVRSPDGKSQIKYSDDILSNNNSSSNISLSTNNSNASTPISNSNGSKETACKQDYDVRQCISNPESPVRLLNKSKNQSEFSL